MLEKGTKIKITDNQSGHEIPIGTITEIVRETKGGWLTSDGWGVEAGEFEVISFE